MGDGVDLVADKVVEAVRHVGVDKAVANPLAGADAVDLLVAASPARNNVDSPLVDVANDLESVLHTVLIDSASLQRSDILLSRES